MDKYRVTHVSKDQSGDITAIGVKDRWRLPVTTAISRIKGGVEGYHVDYPVHADIVVGRTRWGTEYLHTTADTTTRNNLDNLPRL
jgi:hypothetical protein